MPGTQMLTGGRDYINTPLLMPGIPDRLAKSDLTVRQHSKYYCLTYEFERERFLHLFFSFLLSCSTEAHFRGSLVLMLDSCFDEL